MATDIQQFDYDVDLLRAILWQYNQAVNLQSLLEMKKAWYDTNQSDFWVDWRTNVFNLKTADDFGLQVWSIILGQPIYLNRGPVTRTSWGFEQYHVNFTRGNFANQYGASFRLPTEDARLLLRLRYYQLTGAGTVPEINRALADVFSDYGPAYIRDNHDMTQTYVFGFPLTSGMIFLFNNFDALPRPAGVGSSYGTLINDTWGFDQYHANFDNGNFSEQ